MSEPPVELPRERHAPEEPHLPRWVPALIGAVLVIIAGLAVYTGLRYRNPTLGDGIIRPKRPGPAATGGRSPGSYRTAAKPISSPASPMPRKPPK